MKRIMNTNKMLCVTLPVFLILGVYCVTCVWDHQTDDVCLRQ